METVESVGLGTGLQNHVSGFDLDKSLSLYKYMYETLLHISNYKSYQQ